MDIVWLASYPKSGNTWVRFLFTNLIHGPFEYSQTIFDVTPVYEGGIDESKLREDRINLIKTHKKFSPDLRFMSDTRAIVYIVRNPFDVMISNLNYYFLSSGIAAGKPGQDVQAIANQYVTRYLNHGGDPRWEQFNYGTWAGHIDSWLQNSLNLPVKVVRYEDLLADTVSTLAEVCAFLSLDATTDDIKQAADRSSFERMRAMEEKEIREKRPGMFYTSAHISYGDTGVRFMNRGKSGVGLEALSENIIEKYRRVFAPMIDELGYA